MTIDHLSRGRLVVPVGLGALDDSGFGNVGEATANGERADILDETLAILDGLWSGEPFAHEGTRYRFGPMTFRPRPVQRPRIPVWVALRWPGERSMARALRWDGAILQTSDVGEVADIVAEVRTRRAEEGSTRQYDIIAQGTTPADPEAAGAIVQPIADAGATWWVDADWERATPATLLARIAAGPPRVS
jgi:alkanesulfonate monooxygenase SsuD/methylene tetrahydromethanopterin reductase-like flavin-dependent oxidoreductase (luciferase family)